MRKKSGAKKGIRKAASAKKGGATRPARPAAKARGTARASKPAARPATRSGGGGARPGGDGGPATYTPKPIEGIGWQPFRYPPR